MMKTFFILLLILYVASPALADTHAAASCNNVSGTTDIQDAIDAAADGDTVTLPSGTCSIDVKVTVPSTKGISIIGAGIGSTVISEDIGSANFEIDVDDAYSKFRLSGFTLDAVNGTQGAIVIEGDATDWRIDHIAMTNMLGRGIHIFGVTYGVIDHVDFSGVESENCILVHESTDGIASWGVAYTYGSAAAVFVEDCTFDFDTLNTGNSPLDTYAGARVVFRENTLTNMIVGMHGICTSQSSSYRSTIVREIYNNTMTTSPTDAFAMMGQVYGGSGYIYGNRGIGQWNSLAKPVERRTAVGEGVTCTYWDRCNGGSANDGNNALSGAADIAIYGDDGSGTHDGANGAATLTDSGATWTVDYLIGIYVYNVTDGSKCEITDNDGTTVTCTLAGGTDDDWDTGDTYKITNGYPCLDQAGRAPPAQDLAPLYEYDNLIDTDVNGSYETNAEFVLVDLGNTGPSVSDLIIEDRDFYNDTELPAYTAYTYPHPLTGVVADQTNITVDTYGTGTVTINTGAAGSITVQ